MKLLTAEQIDQAAQLLKADELVAFPTETVYGLGARVFSASAIQKIFTAKNRPADNPLIVHISSLDQLHLIAAEIPDQFYQLADAFFPGPLTIILKRHPLVPAIVSAGMDTIAVRMPNHPLAQALIKRVGEPLAAPSANLSGKPSATLPQHVLEDFKGKIAAVIDGGSPEIGIESTVISLVSGDKPQLMRPGIITKQQIEQVLGAEIDVYRSSDKGKIASPGMKYRHYAPRAPILLFQSLKELEAYLNTASPKKRMVLASERVIIRGNASFFTLSMHTLYALLRLSDREGYEEVLVFCDIEDQKNSALMNRLQHATK